MIVFYHTDKTLTISFPSRRKGIRSLIPHSHPDIPPLVQSFSGEGSDINQTRDEHRLVLPRQEFVLSKVGMSHT